MRVNYSELNNIKPPHLAITLIVPNLVAVGAPTESGISYLQSIESSINGLINEIASDYELRNCTDLSIVSYGETDAASIFQSYMPIDHVAPISLDTGYYAKKYIAQALEVAIMETKQRVRDYLKFGIGAWVPWIILITDIECNDDTALLSSIAERIRFLENEGRLNVIFICANKANILKFKSMFKRVYDVHDFDCGKFISSILREALIADDAPVISESVVLPPLPNLPPIQFQ